MRLEPRVRLAAYTDYIYRDVGGVVHAERAFALFLSAVAEQLGGLTVLGRLDPKDGPAHYPLPSSVRFVPLPHYASLTRPIAVISSLLRSLKRFWTTVGEADGVWVLGPQPHALTLAVLARIRRRPLVLGVRQDWPVYVRSRYPDNRWMRASARVMEAIWRRLARAAPVIAVGPELALKYSHAPAVLETRVSLISAEDVSAGEAASRRAYDGELRLLSVGRLDREKNSLMLIDVLARLRATDPRWRLVVCGEGPLRDDLILGLGRAGLREHAEVHGYVPIHGGLLDLYRSSHVFLHVSLTEGVPQVLLEAWASGVPVVATAVGGVAQEADGSALLIPPADPTAAVETVRQVVDDEALRERLVHAGLDHARGATFEHETGAVADFLVSAVVSRPG